MSADEIIPGESAGGTVWEDGLGRKDGDARVLTEERMVPTPDPQSQRYGQGEPEVVIQGVVGGAAFRRRPYVDVYWHEGLRPSFMRLPLDEAERIGAMLVSAASAARDSREDGASSSEISPGSAR